MITNSEETQLMQHAFRQVMGAFARPGTVGHIEPFSRLGEVSCLPAPFETAVRLFVDQAVTFSVAGSAAREQTEWITLQTHAHAAEPDAAAFVLVPDAADAAARRTALGAATAGTLIEPECGATAIVACGALSAEEQPGLARIDLEGPGIKDTASFYVDAADWAAVRAERADEYPCGIEILLVDDEGAVVAVPRTARIACVAPAVGTAPAQGGASWAM